MKILLKVPEAARQLGLAEKSCWSWVYSGKIGFHRIGRSIKIPQSEIDRILDEGYTPPRVVGGAR